MTKQIDQTTEKYDSIFSLFVRVFWALIGNAILLLTTIFIFLHKGAIFYTADIVFWGTVAALVLVRYLDIKLYNGLTITGQPASMSHWRKYTVILLLCSTVVWAIAHAINYLVVNK
jgi:hypothetical protein